MFSKFKILWPLIILIISSRIMIAQDSPFSMDSSFSADLVQFGGGASIWADINNDGRMDLILSGNIPQVNANITVIYAKNIENSYTVTQAFEPGSGYFGDLDAGDVNNDGYIDLIVTGGGNTTLLLNNGGVFSFDANNVFPALLYSTCRLGDIDNDGDLDLFLMGLQYPENKILTKIYMNDPLGTFTVDETQILASLANGDAAFGDYDGDGDLDLAVGGQSAETTSRVMKIYKNEPTGRLIEDTNQSLTGLKASSLDWADIDNDGDLDLLTTGWDGDTQGIPITVLYRNEPVGTLTSYDAGLTFGACYGSLSTGDLDGDGDLDLLISGGDTVDTQAENYLTLNAELFVNDGSGSFSAGGSFPNILHSSVGEFNLDGKPELFLNGFTDLDSLHKVVSEFYLNTSEGTISAPSPPENLSSFAVGNRIILSWSEGSDDETPAEGLNYSLRMGTSSKGHDVFSGRMPLGAANNGHSLIKIFSDKSHGTYYWSVKTEDQQLQSSAWSQENILEVSRLVESNQSLSGVRFNTAQWIDYNGDERLDLALAGISFALGDTATRLFRNEPPNLLTQDLEQDIASVVGGSMSWGDYNNDGFLDFVLSGLLDQVPATFLYRWDSGLEQFLLVSESGLPDVWGGSQRLQWGDYNLDGRLDLLVSGCDAAPISGCPEGRWILDFYQNLENNLFEKDTALIFEPLESIMIALSDFNKDGFLDFAAGGIDTSENSILQFYRGDSLGNFVLSDSILGEGPAAGALDWGDYNNDGYPDLAVAGLYATGPGLKIFENRSGRFLESAVIELEGGVYFGSLDWGDFNNDGTLDLALAGNSTVTESGVGSDPITRIWINNEGSFVRYDSLEGAGTGTVRWGDYDNDGDLDLFVAGISARGDDFAKVFDNLEGVLNKNEKPEAPFGLINQVNLNSVELSWSAALDNLNPLGDFTASEVLSYSLKIYRDTENDLALSGVNPAGDGSQGTSLFRTLVGLKDGSYNWQVRAVDQGQALSPWSSKTSFFIDTTPPGLDTLIVNFFPNNSVIIVVKFLEEFGMDVLKSPDVTVTHPENIFPDTLEVMEQSYSGDVWTGTLTLPEEYPGQFIKITVSKGQDLRGNEMETTIIFRSPPKILASQGGTIISDDGKASLFISPNAVAEDVFIEIKTGGLISSALQDSGWVQFGSIYNIIPDSLKISKPAVFRVTSEISTEDLLLYSSFSLGRVMEDSIMPLGGRSYSENDRNYISTFIDSLGTFGIFAAQDTNTWDKGLTALSFQPRVFSPAGTIFPGKTHLLFSLGNNSKVSIRIYNPAGRLKRTIITNEKMYKGQNVVEWDGKDQRGKTVKSGLYIAVIEAGNNKKAITVGVVNQ